MRSQWQIVILWIWVGVQFINWVPTRNEEMYFALARQFMHPDWAPWSFHFTEFPGARLLFQYFAGYFLGFTSFELFAALGRAVLILLLVWPLNFIFRKLGFRLIVQLVVLQLFIFWDQAYFAGGWIFSGIEAKGFSHILILWAVYALFFEKHIWAVFLAAMACCFHILVGGWFAVGLGVYFVMKREKIKHLLIYAVLFVILTAPFVYYLATGVLLNDRTVIEGVNLDEVYVFLRNPHHTGIYRPWSQFADKHLWPVITLLLSFTISFWLKSGSVTFKTLKMIFQAIAGMVLFNVMVGAFDNHGAFLKFYPFRMAVMALLLFIMLTVVWLQHQMVDKFYKNLTILLFLIPVIPSLAWNVQINMNQIKGGKAFREQMQPLYKAAIDVSQPKEVFLFYDVEKWDSNLDFIRRTCRERFFVYKFVPAGGEKLFDWYQRFRFWQAVQKDLHQLFEPHPYHIDYLISRHELSHPGLEKLTTVGEYSIYGIVKQQ
ncbi:MAG: hypothetical protein ACPF9D_08685 [Owenweeksia sp.]